MKYFIIGTSSEGNGIIYHNEILVDVGFNYKRLRPYLRPIKYIFLTHEHGDHFQLHTIKKIQSERPDIYWIVPKHLVEKIKKINLKNVFVVEAGRSYKIGSYKIKVDELYHDVPNVAYHIYTSDNHKTLHATDTGEIDHISAYHYDLIMLEANHDKIDMLNRMIEKTEKGLFSHEIRAFDVHLSFDQWESFVEKNKGPNTVAIKLHMSSHYTKLEKEEKEHDRKNI